MKSHSTRFLPIHRSSGSAGGLTGIIVVGIGIAIAVGFDIDPDSDSDSDTDCKCARLLNDDKNLTL
jgi:hypothetical protein